MQLTLDERARLDFVLTLRRRWADTLYPALRDQYDAVPQGADVAADVRAQPAYQWLQHYD